MPAKLTMIFGASTHWSNGTGGVPQRFAGFSESWYTDLDPTSSSFRENMDELCSKRSALLSRQASIIAQRVQVVNARGEPGLSILFETFHNGKYGSNDADLPSKALCWYIRSQTSPNHRMMILRGCPDSIAVMGEYRKTAEYQAAVNAFFAELAARWKFMARVRTNPAVKLTSITEGGVFTLQENAPFVNGDYVRLLRVSDVAKDLISGAFKVSNVVGATGTLVGYAQEVGRAAVRGKLRKDEFQYVSPVVDVEELQFPDVITRKAGRPFKGFRGRRSAK